jgi:hypothetical protein
MSSERRGAARRGRCLSRLIWLPLVAALGCTGTWPEGQTPAERRQRIEKMSPTRKAELAEAIQRLEALDPAERQRLRQLNQHIEQDPDPAGLRLAMGRYYEWLRKLPLYRRAEVLELPPAERIATIKKMLQEEEGRSLRRPRPQDAEGLLAWMKDYAARHEAEVLATLPKERREEELHSSPDHRSRLVMSILWTKWPSGKRDRTLAPSESDLADALSRLSSESRQRLESKPAGAQWRLIASWARYLVHYQDDVRHGASSPSEVSEAELVHFFEYELNPEQREYLLGLPGEEMQRQLRRMYFRIKLPRSEFRPPEPLDPIPPPPAPGGAKKPPGKR